MSWFYGEPMNDRDLRLTFGEFTFICSRCDLGDTLYIEDHYKTFKSDPLPFTKAYGGFIGYHATNIRPELNGFNGYDCIDLEIINDEGEI